MKIAVRKTTDRDAQDSTNRSPTRHSLQVFGVSSPLDSDLRRGVFDATQIVWRQLE
jgi:hypothetical protein